MPTRHPGPYRSQLIPYVDQIRAWRRAGKTWREVTEALSKLGIKTDPGTACRFMKRVRDKPYAIGTEPVLTPYHPPAAPGDAQRPMPPGQPEDTAERVRAELERRTAERTATRKLKPLTDDDFQ
jgi:hypothetical protein